MRNERKNPQFDIKKLAYKPNGLSDEILKNALAILVIMPIKKEIKHEWHVMETKIMRM